MLLGEKTKIKAILKSDIEVLHKMYIEPEVIRNMDTRADVSLSLYEKMLEARFESNDHHQGEWLLITDNDDKIVGSITYDYGWNRSAAIVRLYIGKEYQGNGYATDAVKRICKFLFEEKQIARIQAFIREDITAALKVFEKSGFTKEGERRNCIYHNGIYMNEVHMSFLSKEYFS